MKPLARALEEAQESLTLLSSPFRVDQLVLSLNLFVFHVFVFAVNRFR
jgi:hypothetical protein